MPADPKWAHVNFSLVIPTRNRSEALALTLEHLTRQEYPIEEFEVVVVDDGSQDNTPQTLERYARFMPLRWFRQSPQGTSRARNRAIHEARGRHIVFIDDDVFAPADFLIRHARWLKRYPQGLIRGPVVNVNEPLLPPLPSLHHAWKHYSKNYLCTSNASLARDLLLRAGLFDPDFKRWEDAELGIRLKKLGVVRHFDLQTYVFHWKPPVPAEGRLETAQRDGAAAAQLYQRYPSLRLWLRSGLHLGNRVKNQLLQALDPLMPGSLRQWRELEAAYLRSGWQELEKEQP